MKSIILALTVFSFSPEIHAGFIITKCSNAAQTIRVNQTDSASGLHGNVTIQGTTYSYGDSSNPREDAFSPAQPGPISLSWSEVNFFEIDPTAPTNESTYSAYLKIFQNENTKPLAQARVICQKHENI